LNSSAYNLSLPETPSLLDVNETEEDQSLKSQLFELYTEFAKANQKKVDQLLNIEQDQMASLQSEQSLLIEKYAKARSCRKPANTTTLHTQLTRAHANYVRRVQADRQQLAQWQNEQKTTCGTESLTSGMSRTAALSSMTINSNSLQRGGIVFFTQCWASPCLLVINFPLLFSILNFTDLITMIISKTVKNVLVLTVVCLVSFWWVILSRSRQQVI
jgi:hypothetical protein